MPNDICDASAEAFEVAPQTGDAFRIPITRDEPSAILHQLREVATFATRCGAGVEDGIARLRIE